MPAKQLKVGLRVRDLDRSFDLYLRLGFRHLPQPGQEHLRYLTFGHTWLILSDLHRHGHHNAERERETKLGPPGLGFVAAGARAKEAHKSANMRTPYWDWTAREGGRYGPGGIEPGGRKQSLWERMTAR